MWHLVPCPDQPGVMFEAEACEHASLEGLVLVDVTPPPPADDFQLEGLPR
jgi:hypothetical protein